MVNFLHFENGLVSIDSNITTASSNFTEFDIIVLDIQLLVFRVVTPK